MRYRRTTDIGGDMETQEGCCIACQKEARREVADPAHWWHVGYHNALVCLWSMIASADHHPAFRVVDRVDAKALPRQRKRSDATVPARL